MATYDDYCAICGIAIASHEKGTSFQDVHVVDYDEHCEMAVSFNVCRECWQKVKNFLDAGLESAIERRQNIQRYDLKALDRRYNDVKKE